MLVSDIVGLVQGAVAIIRLCDQIKGTRKEIQELKARTEILKKLVEDNQEQLTKNDGIDGLSAVITEVRAYLENRRTGWFYRSPFIEKTFFLRIDSFTKRLESWSIIVVLSLSGRTLTVATATEVQRGSKGVNIYGTNDFARMDPIPPGTKEFCGTLKTGELVRFIAIKKDGLERKKFLSKYRAVSEVASIQRLFGLYTHSPNEYAVMEELQDPRTPYEMLRNSFSTNGRASVADLSKNQRVLLCHRVACLVQFLHSREFIVKVISDKNIFVRKQGEGLVPTLADLDETRFVMVNTTNVSYDERYDPPEYSKGKGMPHSMSTDMWSLGLLLLQILAAKSLPSRFKAADLWTTFEKKSTLEKESERIQGIIGECLNIVPSKRPPSGIVASRLLDEYNDSCARNTFQDNAILEAISRGRKLVDERRLDHRSPQKPKNKFQRADVDVLVGFRGSWDESGPGFRLAPDVSFLIGAGIFWDLIDVNINGVQVSSSIVGRGTGPADDYKNRLALYYLTEAMDMGCYDALLELTKAHKALMERYSNLGGADLNSKIRERRERESVT